MTQENLFNLRKNFPSLTQLSEEIKDHLEETELRILQTLWTLEDAIVQLRKEVLDLQISIKSQMKINDSIDEIPNFKQTRKS